MKNIFRNTYIPAVWAQSKTYRRVLVIVLIYTVLRLGFQAYFISGAFSGTVEDGTYPPDLKIYLDAGQHFRDHDDLYLKGSLEKLEEHYPYAPSFAILFIPFSWISQGLNAVIFTLLHLAAYIALYLWWNRIFRRLNLEQAQIMLAWTLPIWLIFAGFWADMYYLNIYVPMALLGTVFIEALLMQRLGWSVVWLAIILQIKPHWAFAAAVPLLLGQYRFFGKLLLWTLLVYVATIGAVLLIGGPHYGWQQHIDYVNFLGRLSRDFPWRGPEKDYLGYNHSIRQIVYYVFGISAATRTLATGIKVLLLVPLAITGLRYLSYRPQSPSSVLSLEWAFALYMAAFIWLDMVWEVTLGIAIFAYILSIPRHRYFTLWLWITFITYSLVDVIQVFSYGIGGDAVMELDAYVLTDPSIYIPIIMIVILTFYSFFVWRLWTATQYLEHEKISWTFKPFSAFQRRKSLS